MPRKQTLAVHLSAAHGQAIPIARSHLAPCVFHRKRGEDAFPNACFGRRPLIDRMYWRPRLPNSDPFALTVCDYRILTSNPLFTRS